MNHCSRRICQAAVIVALPCCTANALWFGTYGSWDTQTRKDAADAALTLVCNRFNAYGDFNTGSDGWIDVYYNSGVPTANASWYGAMTFGGTWPGERVALHEANHWLGSVYGHNMTGPRTNLLLEQFDGVWARLSNDGTHFWPYGMNYDSEWSEVGAQRNVALMYAMRGDWGAGPTSNPTAWAATTVTLTANDTLGESGFNYGSKWSDNTFAHPNAGYSTGNFLLRTPASGSSFTFAGASLTINNTNGINGGLLYKGSGATGVTNFKNLILDGGYVRHASGNRDTFRLAGRVTLNNTSTIDAAQGPIIVTANLSGSGSLTKTGGFVATLSGGNNYAGNTTVSAGILRLSPSIPVANYTFDNVSGSTVTNDGSGGSTMNGALANGAAIVGGGKYGNAVSLASGASVDINNGIIDMHPTGNWTVSAWVKTSTAGATLLSKSGGGWSDGNTILYLGDGSGGGSGGIPSSVRYAGGFFQGAAGTTAVNNNAWHLVTYVNNAGTWVIYVDGVAKTLSSGNAGYANADISSIVKLGLTTNTVPADGTVNYNGLMDNVQFYSQALSAEQVAAMAQGASIGVLPITTTVSISSGATLDVNGVAQQIASLSGPSGSSVTLGSGQLIVSSASGTSTFSGTISGSGGSLVKSGASTLTLGGANSYTGGTTISGGVLKVANNSALGSGSVILNGGALSSDNLSGTEPTISNAITVSTASSITGGAGTLFRVNGNISGNAALGLSGILSSAGLRLGGNNSAYAGTVTVTGANTRLGSGNAGSAAANWVVDGNLQTDVVGGATFHLGALSGSGNISGHSNNASAAVSTLSVGALNTSTSFLGTIIDNALNDTATGNSDGAQNNKLSLTKLGSGTLILGGANTYTGNTTVTGGTLKLTAAAFTPITGTSASGAVLDGGRLIMDYTGSTSPKALLVDDPAVGIKANAANPTIGRLRTNLATSNTEAIGWREDGTIFQARYTHKGDIDLDGVVTSLDFTAFALSYGMTTGAQWGNGDFDYGGTGAGKVSTEDFNFLAGNFGLPALGDSLSDAVLGAVVPEPAGAFYFISMGLCLRRWSRRTR